MVIVLLAIFAAIYKRFERIINLTYLYCQLFSYPVFVKHNRSKNTCPSQMLSTRAKQRNVQKAATGDCRDGFRGLLKKKKKKKKKRLYSILFFPTLEERLRV